MFETVLILVSIIVFSSVFNTKTGLIMAFLLGLLVDLWYGNTLGMSTILFLGIASLVNLYKKNFRATSIWFLAPFSLLIVVGLYIVQEGRIVSKTELLGLVTATTLVVVSFWILIKLWHTKTKTSDLSV